jgi:hypothetical protein
MLIAHNTPMNFHHTQVFSWPVAAHATTLVSQVKWGFQQFVSVAVDICQKQKSISTTSDTRFGLNAVNVAF